MTWSFKIIFIEALTSKVDGEGFNKKSVIGVFIRCKLISFLWEVQISFLQVNAVQIWISQKCVCVRFHFCRILNVKMTLSLSQMQLYGVFLLNCYWRE